MENADPPLKRLALDRREVLALAGGAASSLIAGTGGMSMASAQSRTPAIVMMSAVELSEAIKAKRVSSVEVMTAFLDHIARLNPRVNAIVSLQDRGDLLRQARERDDELARGNYRGWMHGMPQAIKDLAPAKGIRMTMGSPLFKDFIAPNDAIHVERVKRAGAIIIGKTNTPEFGLGSQTYNPVFGTTLNAYDQTRTPGGSSGGAACALALRMLPVADGSDSGGSLRNPAAYSNLFGLRPSSGRVPSESLDVFNAAFGVSGPLARTVTDLAMLLSVQAGYDARAPQSNRQDPAQFAGSLRRDFKGVRVAWLGDFKSYLPFEPGVLDLCRGALKVFESLGCIVEEAVPDYPLERVWQSWIRLRAWQNGAALRSFYQDPAKRALMKPEAQYEVESALKLSALDIADASASRTAWYQTVRRFSDSHEFLLVPSAQVFPFDAGTHWPKEIAGRSMDTYHRWMEVASIVTMTGCPALNVPVGFDARGLPMGLQIVGRNQAEMSCLQLARAYEEATGWVEMRRPALLGA